MKTRIIFLFLSLFYIAGCESMVEQKAVEQNDAKLQLSFKNISSYKLSNFIVSDKLIGTLPPDAASGYIAFEKFGFDTGMPDENASAMVNGVQLTNHYRGFWCGTEKLTADSGKYIIEVEIVQDTMLFLSCKNAPTIFSPEFPKK